MSRHPFAPRRARLLRASLPICLALAASSAAHAQSSPYTLRVSQNFDYESNLFRTPDNERRDLISTTALTLGVDQGIGRQRVFASGTVDRQLYKNNSELNNTGYSLTAGLDWEAASRLSGLVQLNAARSQARFESYGELGETVRGSNLEESRSIDLRGQYGGTGLLSLEALANYTTVDYTDAAFGSRERDSAMFGGGVRWRPTGLWTFGLIARQTRGEYPASTVIGGIAQADEYDRTDIDLTAEWAATGLSSFGLRLTHSREEHDLDEARDFSGLTGELIWNYRLSGRVAMVTTLARDTGTGTSSSLLSPPPGTAPTTPPGEAADRTSYLTDGRLTTRFGTRLTWQATGKVRVQAGLDYARERFDTRFVGPGAAGGDNSRGSTRRIDLGATWEATRVWSVFCGAGHEKRDTDATTTSGASYGFSATTGYCGAALALQL